MTCLEIPVLPPPFHSLHAAVSAVQDLEKDHPEWKFVIVACRIPRTNDEYYVLLTSPRQET